MFLICSANIYWIYMCSPVLGARDREWWLKSLGPQGDTNTGYLYGYLAELDARLVQNLGHIVSEVKIIDLILSVHLVKWTILYGLSQVYDADHKWDLAIDYMWLCVQSFITAKEKTSLKHVAKWLVVSSFGTKHIFTTEKFFVLLGLQLRKLIIWISTLIYKIIPGCLTRKTLALWNLLYGVFADFSCMTSGRASGTCLGSASLYRILGRIIKISLEDFLGR